MKTLPATALFGVNWHKSNRKGGGESNLPTTWKGDTSLSLYIYDTRIKIKDYQ